MMKMNWTKSTILLAGSFMTMAHAQPPYRGTFTLPVEAHFGSVVLQPGEYSILQVAGTDAIRVRGDGGTATILPSAVGARTESEHGTITLANVNGTFVFTRFECGTLGSSFEFRVPKGLNKSSERASLAQPTAAALEIGVK